MVSGISSRRCTQINADQNENAAICVKVFQIRVHPRQSAANSLVSLYLYSDHTSGFASHHFLPVLIAANPL